MSSQAIAYSYIRFSSKKQEEGDSIRRQEDLRDAWLKRHAYITLDTKLKFEDRGISAHRGKNREIGELYRFLDLVESQKIPPGSYLIVENLDRLTREEPDESIPLVLSLTRAGVKVVQLSPSEQVYEKGMDLGRMMGMLCELVRGYQESARKAEMCAKAWDEKKRKARENNTPHGKRCPAWLKCKTVYNAEKGKSTVVEYEIKSEAVKAIKLIVKCYTEGMGIVAIIDRLKKEKVPAFGRTKRWVKSYVTKLLADKALIGTFQPHKNVGERRPDGPPIEGYYPAVLTKKEWYAVEAANAVRKGKTKGRDAKKREHSIFAGLAYCALDQHRMHVLTRQDRRLLISGKIIYGGSDARWCTFPLEQFTTGILGKLQELQASSLFKDPGAEKITDLTGRIAEVEKRLKQAVARFDADSENQTWGDLVDKYDQEKRTLAKELAHARIEAANPQTATWAEATELMKAWRERPNELRAALLATVESIQCVIVASGSYRLCGCQVFFRNSDQRRGYIIGYRPATAGAVPQRAGWFDVVSIPDARQIDLRDREDAEALEAELQALELPF